MHCEEIGIFFWQDKEISISFIFPFNHCIKGEEDGYSEEQDLKQTTSIRMSSCLANNRNFGTALCNRTSDHSLNHQWTIMWKPMHHRYNRRCMTRCILKKRLNRECWSFYEKLIYSVYCKCFICPLLSVWLLCEFVSKLDLLNWKSNSFPTYTLRILLFFLNPFGCYEAVWNSISQPPRRD